MARIRNHRRRRLGHGARLRLRAAPATRPRSGRASSRRCRRDRRRRKGTRSSCRTSRSRPASWRPAIWPRRSPARTPCYSWRHRNFSAASPPHAPASWIRRAGRALRQGDRARHPRPDDRSLAEAALPDAPIAVLSGPTFAREVARGLPTAVTLAGADARSAGRWALIRHPRSAPIRRATIRRRGDRRRGQERARHRLRHRRRQEAWRQPRARR